MHVQILGTRGIPSQHGGFETFAQDLSLYLVAQGHAVTVYCQAEPSAEPAEDHWNGVRRVHIPAASSARGTIHFDWKSTLHSCRESGIPLVLGYNTAVFSILYRLLGRRSLMNMDGLEWKREKWSFLQRLWLRFNEFAGAKLSTHLVADHPEIGLHLAKLVRAEKISVIPYSADAIGPVQSETHVESSLRERIGVEPNGYVLVVARPEPENSILEIVEGFSAKPRGIKLLVLGKLEPEVNSYHRRVLQAAGSEVIFPGAIYDKPLMHVVRSKARIYLHGHRVGGTNPSLVESLAAGNPVVAHDNCFNRWVAGPGSVYFRSPEDLSMLLDGLLNDDTQLARMSSLSRERHAAEFTGSRVLPAYVELLTRFSHKQDVAASPQAFIASSQRSID